jgi:processive 1,2-diacylglycerol beta-glucosyltransferase
VKKAYDEMKLPGVEVTLIDALDYTNDFFRWSYLQAYLLMVNKLPTLWGLSYYLTDIPFVDLFVSVIRRFNNWANSKKLVKYILDTKPDVIISTHFFGSEVIADLKPRAFEVNYDSDGLQAARMVGGRRNRRVCRGKRRDSP